MGTEAFLFSSVICAPVDKSVKKYWLAATDDHMPDQLHMGSGPIIIIMS